MIRAALLSVLASAMLIQLARAQNITTTGLSPNLAQSFAQSPCDDESLYIRNLDGSCNHLGNNYSSGQVGNYYYRGPEGEQYAPGTTSDPWTIIDPRVISNAIGDDGQPPTLFGAPFGDEVLADQPVNILSVFFGQFVNHDMENNKVPPLSDLSDIVVIANVTNDPVFHCSPPGTNNSNPFNPTNDCFLRAGKSLGAVVNGHFEVVNQNNGWVDLSTIYSDKPTQSDALRTHQDGLLRLRDWTADGGGYANFTTTVKNTLISQADTGSIVDGDIGAAIPPDVLMVSGDMRASQDIPLTIMHVVWIREHNYQATRYRALFPSATDEQLFQLARRYTIGEFQKVVYEEFLPVILCRPLSPYKGYDSSVATDTSTAFATGAFRYGHTVSRDFDMYDGCSSNGDSLLSMYDNATALQIDPARLLFQGQVFVLGIPGSTALDYPPARILALMGGRHGDGLDNLISSMVRQRSARSDPMFPNTLRNIPANIDLLAIDIFRGRDNGLPNYNTFRTYYHPQGSIYSNPACSSADVVDCDACWAVLTPNKTVAAQLKNLYGKVNKVDALVGMIAEDLNGEYLSPTVVGVVANEFTRKRDGDRFFYENEYYYSSEEISSIKSTSFRDIIQRNTGVVGLPANVFLTTEGTNTGEPRSTQCT